MTSGKLVLYIIQAANIEYTPSQSEISKVHSTWIDKSKRMCQAKECPANVIFYISLCKILVDGYFPVVSLYSPQFFLSSEKPSYNESKIG